MTIATAGAQITALLVAFYALPMDRGGPVVIALLVLAVVMAVIPVSVRNARMVLTSKRPGIAAVRAAALLATVIVVTFASAYFMLARQAHGQMSGLRTKTDALYFTMTVLST